ncbi:hypothetical protein LCGC14_1203220 [marine sediment metagenome]|uniref:Transcription regulator TrmB N-terminal domain-containing protein n=1 Tax=marine sediment metagenome TaxID=412755 RepID=A0A0F9PL04_9ZZZZ
MSEFEIEILHLTSIQLKIFKELSYGKSITRGTLAKKLNIPYTTIYDNLIKLQLKKFVRQYSRKTNKIRGRSSVFWYMPRYVLKVFRKFRESEPTEGMKKDLDELFEKGIEIFAKVFHIHVSGNLSKLDINRLLEFAEKYKGDELDKKIKSYFY